MSGWYRQFGKRTFDLAVAVPLLLLISPLLAVIALLIRWRMGRPVVFRQERGGLGGNVFYVRKFRTMLDACDENGEPLPDDRRLTRLGNLLRKLSLDELPQLWNVVCGDMSLIGPRPFLAEYLDRYSPEQARRHEVRPGITGWAQINGRNAVTWEEKFEMDVWYVDHLSCRLDMKIFWLTLLRVITRHGVSADKHATMPKFMGSNSTQPLENGTS